MVKTFHTHCARLLCLLVCLHAGSGAAPGQTEHARVGHMAQVELRAALASKPAPRRGGAPFRGTSAHERRPAVDDFWGAGEPTEVKPRIFDQFWEYLGRKYAAFQGLDVDWRALRDRYRPQVAAGFSRGRSAATFDLPTQEALGTEINLGPDWFARIAEADFYRAGAPHDHLTHSEFPVDERVWLRPEDVAAGKDTVVEAALLWLRQQAP